MSEGTKRLGWRKVSVQQAIDFSRRHTWIDVILGRHPPVVPMQVTISFWTKDSQNVEFAGAQVDAIPTPNSTQGESDAS